MGGVGGVGWVNVNVGGLSAMGGVEWVGGWVGSLDECECGWSEVCGWEDAGGGKGKGYR